MKFRHTIVRGLVAGLLLTLLVACAGSNVPVETADPTPIPNSSSPNVTLVLWHGWAGAERQALYQLVDVYNQQRPSGRVLTQSVPLASFGNELLGAAAAGPHIMLIPSGWVGSLAASGVLLPLDDLLSPAEQSALLPVTVSSATAFDSAGEQSLYGLPITFDTLALFYNAANIESPPENTNSLTDLARGLTDTSAPRWGMAVDLSLDNTIGYLYAFGGRVFNAEGELVLGTDGREGAERWLEWLAALNSDSQMLARLDSGIRVDRELNTADRVVMTFGWSHQLTRYRRLWGDQMGIAPLPELSETGEAPSPHVQSMVLALNGQVSAAERTAALDFLRFMVSEDAQRVLLQNGLQPSLERLSLDGEAEYLEPARVFRMQAQRGQPILNGPQRDTIRQSLQIMQQQVLRGNETPADAVTNADARLRTTLGLGP